MSSSFGLSCLYFFFSIQVLLFLFFANLMCVFHPIFVPFALVFSFVVRMVNMFPGLLSVYSFPAFSASVFVAYIPCVFSVPFFSTSSL